MTDACPRLPDLPRLLSLLGLIGLFGVVCFAAGCESKPLVSTMSVPADAYDKAFATTVDTLRDLGLTVDQEDYRFGRVTTTPLPGSTFGEVWRDDHATNRQALRATLHHQRRIVSVTIRPEADADRSGPTNQAAPQRAAPRRAAPYMLLVEVMIEQQETPTKRLSGATRAGVFHSLRETPSELADRGIPNSYWRPLERDPYMEDRIRRAIAERL